MQEIHGSRVVILKKPLRIKTIRDIKNYGYMLISGVVHGDQVVIQHDVLDVFMEQQCLDKGMVLLCTPLHFVENTGGFCAICSALRCCACSMCNAACTVQLTPRVCKTVH